MRACDRVDESEPVLSAEALRDEQLSSGEVEEIAAKIVFDRRSVGRFYLEKRDVAKPAMDLWRIAEVDRGRDPEHVEGGTVDDLPVHRESNG